MNLRKIRGQAGFSLLELSIATAIYSMGLGGLSLMMLSAVHGTADARHRTVAVAEASSLAETILMNPAAFGHFIDPLASGANACMSGDACAEDLMAASEMERWAARLNKQLQHGSGLVCRDTSPEDGDPAGPACDGAGPLVVKIFWQEPAEGEDNGLRRQVARLPW